MIIRPVVLEDASWLAWVRQLGWQSAYRGIIPDSVLDQMDHEKGTVRWRDMISNQNPAETCLFCTVLDGQVVGFCGAGAERDQDPDYDSELYALYVLPEKQRLGLGRALAEATMDWLRGQRYRKMLIWVLRDNHPARRFYEALGGVAVRERFVEIGGANLAEVGYGYRL